MKNQFIILCLSLALFGCNENDRSDLTNVRVSQTLQLKDQEGQVVSIPRGAYDGWAISQYEQDGRKAVVITDGSNNFPFESTGKDIMLPGEYGNGVAFKLSGSRTGQSVSLEMVENDQRNYSDFETTESCDISDSATVCRREIKPGGLNIGSGSCQSYESDCKCESITVTHKGSRRVKITSGTGATTFTFILRNPKGVKLATMQSSYAAQDDRTALETCR